MNSPTPVVTDTYASSQRKIFIRKGKMLDYQAQGEIHRLKYCLVKKERRMFRCAATLWLNSVYKHAYSNSPP